MKQEYKAPEVVRLGSVAEDTKSGDRPYSDVEPFANNTAFPPPDPGSS